MSTSLSLILPIRNAQAALAQHVSHLLDVLMEMTPNFELVIVDDASQDHTDEVAAELVREYPQVRLVRHSEPLGHQAAVESGLRLATGELILVHPPGGPVHANDLLRAWRTRDTLAPQIPASGAKPRPVNAGLLERLRQFGTKSNSAALAAQNRNTLAVIRRWENDDSHLAENRTIVKIGSRRPPGQKPLRSENAMKYGKNGPLGDDDR